MNGRGGGGGLIYCAKIFAGKKCNNVVRSLICEDSQPVYFWKTLSCKIIKIDICAHVFFSNCVTRDRIPKH